jgi:hypothetical protein
MGWAKIEYWFKLTVSNLMEVDQQNTLAARLADYLERELAARRYL